MVHDPHTATLTAIVAVTHPAFILLDPTEQQRRVTSWGRVLATACRSTWSTCTSTVSPSQSSATDFTRCS